MNKLLKYRNDYHSIYQIAQKFDIMRMIIIVCHNDSTQINMSPVSQPLPPALDRIIQRFKQISESKRRYEYLLHFAKRLPAFPDDQKIEANRVPGCASQVYVVATIRDGKVAFQADSDAQITKGLVGLLVEGLDGLTPTEIMQLTPHFIQQTGLDVSLTPSRANGFYNIFQMMQKRALVCHLTETYSQS